MSDEDEAIKKIMQLAIYGAVMQPKPKDEERIYETLNDVLELFKVAGLIE